MRRIGEGVVALLTAASAVALIALAATGGRLLIVQGGSMRPTLQPGDVVVVRPCGGGQLNRGDIVTCGPGGRSATVTHRIVSISSNGRDVHLRTRGDANVRADGVPHTSSDVQGRVVAVLPRIGIAARLLRTPWGFAAGVVGPAGLLAIGEYRRLRRGLRQRRRAVS